MQSPSWTEPLSAFIDEYCVLFEAEEAEAEEAEGEEGRGGGGGGGKESRFIHTKVHELFKDLVRPSFLVLGADG